MISFIISYWNKMKPSGKFWTVVISLLLIIVVIQSSRLAFSEYKRLKLVEEKYEKINEKIELSEKKELEIVTKNKSNTIKSKQTNESINKKQIEDEKIIDNSSVSNTERESFISKYENQR